MKACFIFQYQRSAMVLNLVKTFGDLCQGNLDAWRLLLPKHLKLNSAALTVYTCLLRQGIGAVGHLLVGADNSIEMLYKRRKVCLHDREFLEQQARDVVTGCQQHATATARTSPFVLEPFFVF